MSTRHALSLIHSEINPSHISDSKLQICPFPSPSFSLLLPSCLPSLPNCSSASYIEGKT